MRNQWVGVCLTLLLCFGTASVVQSAQTWSATPETVINGISYAIDFADAALFDELVDTRGVCAQAVDMFFEKSRTPEGRATLPPALGLIFSSLGGVQAKDTVGGMLANETQAFIRYGVSSGKFGGNPKPNAAPPNGMLANLFASASMGRKEIRDMGAATYPDDHTAIIPFNVYDHDNGRLYAVQAQLHNQDGAWRVTRIANLEGLLDAINKEASE